MAKSLLPLDTLTNENTNALLAPVVVPSFVVDRRGTLPLLVAVPSTAPTCKAPSVFTAHCGSLTLLVFSIRPASARAAAHGQVRSINPTQPLRPCSPELIHSAPRFAARQAGAGVWSLREARNSKQGKDYPAHALIHVMLVNERKREKATSFRVKHTKASTKRIAHFSQLAINREILVVAIAFFL